MNPVMSHHTETWQELAREAYLDHLTSSSICILACNELDQNGCSEGAATPTAER